VCAANTSYVPPAVGLGDLRKPVSGVDWCDAYMYCTWKGKRLCDASRWKAACTKSDAQKFPYGDTLDVTACNTGTSASENVATRATCQGGYPGIFDMVGNLWELQSTCTGDAGATDPCNIAGGSFTEQTDPMGCGAIISYPRSTSGSNVGFRCCSP
jgi:formylglycine-generating enzyme required for sulfatase activity